MFADGRDVMPEVRAELEKIRGFVTGVHEGRITGFKGGRFTDVVNIGIGGSDLGIVMATEALGRYRNRAVRLHSVSNIDGVELSEVIEQVNPATTLFVICSKTFTTLETLSNAKAARKWLVGELGEAAVDRHFVAVSTNAEEVQRFGIRPDKMFVFWDWVGGRYSLWSAIGLSIALAIGMDNFEQLLGGAHAMDEHFRSAELRENMPVLLALLGVWYTNFAGADSHAVLPYDQYLCHLPAYLQQADMESNGKRVSSDGRPLSYSTAPVLWGSAGTMGQHSFHQLLHQGTLLCPADFVLPLTTHTGMPEQHRRLVANGLAQSRTLMVGRSVEAARAALLQRGHPPEDADRLAPHLAMPGNRPNSLITMASLTPATLGALLALYEHRTFCSARLWHINPFDQWGVELGKEIGSKILARLSGEAGAEPMDPATERLMLEWREAQSGAG